ncbi:hypothetical protein FoTM2_007404 [Fusarium oxysporum f. sp. vasinfectum]|nr:hypothetical protein FoTM2_007404 [Fusarium oxysporum f. sp. vasinfectum]
MFIAAVVSYFDKTGVKYVVMDFRKECRRDQEDCCCPILNRTEIEVCGIAMMTEVFIARNIYGVKDKSFEPLPGTLYSTQWHPRAAIDLATEYIPQEDATLAKSSQRRRCDLPADYVVSTKPFLEKIRLEARKAMMPTLLNDFQEGILKFILEKEFTEDQHDVVWQVAHKRFQQNVASWKSQTLALIKYKIEELELSAETRNQNGDVAFSIPWRTLRLSLLGVITTQYTSVAKSGKKPSGLGLVLARWDEIWKSKKMENRGKKFQDLLSSSKDQDAFTPDTDILPNHGITPTTLGVLP